MQNISDSEIAKILNNQHPNSWYKGNYYPAEYNGVSVQIMRSSGKGKNSKKHYLNIKKPTKINIKTPSGEILSTRDGFSYYRIQLYKDDAKFEQVDFF